MFTKADALVDGAIAAKSKTEKDAIMERLLDLGIIYSDLFQEYPERSDRFPMKEKKLENQALTWKIVTTGVMIINTPLSIIVGESTKSMPIITIALLGHLHLLLFVV